MSAASVHNAATVFIDEPLREGLGGRVALVTAGRATLTYAELRGAGRPRGACAAGPRRRARAAGGPAPSGRPCFRRHLLRRAQARGDRGPAQYAARTGRPPGYPRRLPSEGAVADPDLLAPLRPALERAAVATATSVHDLLSARSANPLAAEPVGPDAMAFWLYTSGTTGSPKAAVHCHRTLLACRHYGGDVLGVTARDRVFATSKLFFAYALGNALLSRSSPRRARISIRAGPIPDAVQRGDARATGPRSSSRCRRSMPGSSAPSCPPTPSARCAAASRRESGCPPRSTGPGASASASRSSTASAPPRPSSWCSRNRPGPSRPGSSGTPVPGTEARILDADGAPAVRGPARACSGCERRRWPRATGSGSIIPAGPLSASGSAPGDVYRRDAEGFYYHCGREDDFFKVAGPVGGARRGRSRRCSAIPACSRPGVVGAEEIGGLIKPFVFVVPARSPSRAAGSPTSCADRWRARCRRISGRARSSSSASCRAPPPASSSASGCAKS